MRKRTRLILLAVAASLLGYLLVVVFAATFQNRLAFPGAQGDLPTPREAGFADGSIVAITTADSQTITGWFLPAASPPADGAPALLWFHGNRETVLGVSDFIRFVRPPHVAVLALDYRGYGTSTGSPTETNAYNDAELAWEYLAAQPGVDADRIALYGRSIGSAVALELAQRRPVVGVIADSPFSSARDMGQRHYPFLPSSLGRLKLDNVSNARRLKAPLLVLHGDADYIAPVEMGEAVAHAGLGSFIVFPETGHNDMYSADPERYRQVVFDFLAEVFEP